MCIRRLLVEAGIDLERDEVNIAPVPGTQGRDVNFGVAAARALEQRRIDGFWANGMGAELAVRRGVGTLVLDVRRGDGPLACFNYTMPVIVATDELIERAPETATAAIRAIMATQRALKEDLGLATKVGRSLFPAEEASLIADLIRRDLPFYDPTISPAFVAAMTEFARSVGLQRAPASYGQVVAQELSHLWTESAGH
jgi:ABC-type nitrate/sulfonate/bicarbonate transport system substrate-binding protein